MVGSVYRGLILQTYQFTIRRRVPSEIIPAYRAKTMTRCGTSGWLPRTTGSGAISVCVTCGFVCSVITINGVIGLGPNVGGGGGDGGCGRITVARSVVVCEICAGGRSGVTREAGGAGAIGSEDHGVRITVESGMAIVLPRTTDQRERENPWVVSRPYLAGWWRWPVRAGQDSRSSAIGLRRLALLLLENRTLA